MSAPAAPVFALPAEVTFAAVPALDAEVARIVGDDVRGLVVDRAATQFLCSGGLGMLVKWGKRLADRGGSLVLARPQSPVQKLLRAVGLDAVLPAFADLADAKARAAKPLHG